MYIEEGVKGRRWEGIREGNKERRNEGRKDDKGKAV